MSSIIKPKRKVVLLDNFGGMNLDGLERYSNSNGESIKFIKVACRRTKGSISLKDFQGVFHLATAKVVVTNNHLDMPYPLRSDVAYIQLWHGTFPIKKIGQEMQGGYVNSLKNEPRVLSSVVVSSKAMVDTFARSFGVPSNHVKVLGSPSTDSLFRSDVKRRTEVRNMLGFRDGETVLLYAPTFRENQSPELMFKKMDLEGLAARLPQNYKIALRLHRNSRAVLKRELPRNVVDVSGHASTEEVLIAADVLVSDYSGVIFDFAILEKPIFLFTYDLDEYSDPKLERGLNLLPGDGLPFRQVRDIDDIASAVTADCTDSIELTRQFKMKWFSHRDGASTERVARHIQDLLGGA